MIAAKILCLTGSAAFAAPLVALVARRAPRAGWIGGVWLIGCAAAVPVLVGLTDRGDPRLVFLSEGAIVTAARARTALARRSGQNRHVTV